MRPYEEMGDIMRQINVSKETWDFVYGKIRDFIISCYTWKAEEEILKAAAEAKAAVKELEGNLEKEFPSEFSVEKSRLIELIYLQLNKNYDGLLYLSAKIESERQAIKEEEEKKKKVKKEAEKRERESDLAWRRRLLKRAKTYTPDKFKRLYKKFTQEQTDEGEWFAGDAIAYLNFMLLHQDDNEFPLDILQTTGFIIPVEHRVQFLKEFVEAVIEDVQRDQDNDENIHPERYATLVADRINWDII